MARFKVNDLITDGHSTLWVTGVTDTHYEFTEQSFNKFSRPIEAIDANFRLWESKKIWHTTEEQPINGKEALIEYGNDWHYVGYYYTDSDSFQIGIEDYVERSRVARWAYIEDLTQL